MKLVIDIPKEIYQHYKKVWQKRRGSIPESCIAFGTPLPQEPVFDKIKAEVLEYIDDLDIANEICGVFDKYKAESEDSEE